MVKSRHGAARQGEGGSPSLLPQEKLWKVTTRGTGEGSGPTGHEPKGVAPKDTKSPEMELIVGK